MATLPSFELHSLPKVGPSELRLLWVNDWYDGPHEAVVDFRGERCLMVLHDQDLASERPYHWVLFRLTPEQIADEERWHALFAENVGEHWCFHGTAITHPDPSPEGRKPERFFSAHRERPPVDLRSTIALAWTDEMPNR